MTISPEMWSPTPTTRGRFLQKCDHQHQQREEEEEDDDNNSREDKEEEE